MANRCRQMMKQDMEDSDISAEPGTREFVSSDYMKKRSNSSSSLKKRLLSAVSFSFSGCWAGSSLSVKGGPDDLPRLCNSDLSRTYHHLSDETASRSSTNSPFKQENLNLNHLVEDVNKDADNFIAKMREGLKNERKVSEMEYMDRIQRGA